jgi:hypothetical protein
MTKLETKVMERKKKNKYHAQKQQKFQKNKQEERISKFNAKHKKA